MSVPLGTGIVVLWPCILEIVNVVSSTFSFRIATACNESQFGTPNGLIQILEREETSVKFRKKPYILNVNYFQFDIQAKHTP